MPCPFGRRPGVSHPGTPVGYFVEEKARRCPLVLVCAAWRRWEGGSGLPVDRRLALCGKPAVDGAEGARAEETAAGRERRGVGAFQPEVAIARGYGHRAFCAGPPQSRKARGPSAAVAARISDVRACQPRWRWPSGWPCGHGKDGVEEEHTLVGPAGKVAVAADLAGVGGQFGKDVAQAVAGRLFGREGEGKPVARPGVG